MEPLTLAVTIILSVWGGTTVYETVTKPDHWLPGTHRDQMREARDMCEDAGVKSYNPSLGKVECFPRDKGE